MATKRTRKSVLETKIDRDQPGYVTWSSQREKAGVLERASASTLEGCQAVNHSSARVWQDYRDIGGPGISSFPGFTRDDFNAFRPEARVPTEYKDIIAASNYYYYTVGIIRNILDLMSDFASQGIRISHPNKRKQKWYKNWFERVNGVERSERFLNLLYRNGNVIIRVQTGKLSKIDNEDIQKSAAALTLKSGFTLAKKEVPMKFNFLNPAMVDVVGGALANFIGQPQYAISMAPSLKQSITKPKTPEEQKLIADLPPEILAAAKNNKPVLLPQDRTLVYHYKKDDWQTWANPMMYSVMDDIQMLEQLRLADRTTLDGAINNLRIIKLGNIEQGIFPQEAAFNKMASAIQGNTGGGLTTIIWGPDAELLETSSDIYKILGEEKYKPHLNAIYSGLGIPQTLTGSGAGTTNNFISMRTLVERLEYGRTILLKWWNTILAAMQKSMGDRFAAKIEFDRMSLSDDASEKALLVQLADRGLLSDELLQYKFKHDPDLEKVRLKRENKEREEGKMVGKISPYMAPLDPYQEGLKKVALQSGVATPSEVGLELEEKAPGEVNALELKAKQATQKNSGVPGRPKNAKDKSKRKTKTFSPKLKANLAVWTKNAQDYISAELNDLFLENFGKANFRQLSTEQAEQVENIKFSVLLSLDPMSKLTAAALEKGLAGQQNVYDIMRRLEYGFVQEFGYQPSYADLRELQKAYYIQIKELENGNDLS